ncbi:MAG: hypothetical protein ABI568_08115 [Pseudarthrobacter sp.]
MPVSPRRLVVAGGVCLAAASLGGCEYADAGPQPGGSTAAPAPAPVPVPNTISPEEAARQAELIAEVESLMGPPDEFLSLGVTGGMLGGEAISSSGFLRDSGAYALRAACTDGPGAMLTVRQNGALLVSQRIDCGAPYDAVLELASGEVAAALEAIGNVGRVGGAVRFAGPLPPGETGAAS